MLSFDKIHAKEHPPNYHLRDKVEKLFEYLEHDGSRIGYFDVITFLINQVFIKPTYKLPPDKGILKSFLLELKFETADQLPPSYGELFKHLSSVFGAPLIEIHEAKPHLLEHLCALAMNTRYHGAKVVCNCKFYDEADQLIKGDKYIDSNLKPRFHDEVDVVVNALKIKSNDIGLFECKSTPGTLEKEIIHVYPFYELLAKNLIKDIGDKIVNIVFVVPVDRLNLMSGIIAGQNRKREVYSYILASWQNPFQLHH
jgi:hypothetical protein